MVRRNRPTPTPLPTTPDPDLIGQMMSGGQIEGVQCECGNVIKACHLERHRRSKAHTLSLNWVRQQGFMAMAQHAQRVSAPPAEDPE
jgi:hypothetical protein